MYFSLNHHLVSCVFILSSVLWSSFAYSDEEDYRNMLQLQQQALITSPSTGTAIAITQQVFLFVCQKQLTTSELSGVMQSSDFHHLVQQIETRRRPVGITTGRNLLEEQLERYRCTKLNRG